jgi:dipeptidyl-peptidase-4
VAPFALYRTLVLLASAVFSAIFKPMKKLLLGGLLVFLASTILVRAQEKPLTLADIYDPDKKISFEGTVPVGFAWLKDGRSYLERMDDPASPLIRISAETGARTPFFDAGKLQAALVAGAGLSAEDAQKEVRAASFIVSPDEEALLMYRGQDLYYYSIAPDQLRRLTDSAELEKEAQFSPDGRKVAFVRNNNLYCVAVSGGAETQLTQDGGDKTLNGVLDWIYQEEVYGRGHFRAFWWSPDSSRLAFLQLSEEGVPSYPILDDVEVKATVEETLYPRSGETNPRARLGVVSVDDGRISWVPLDQYGQEEILIVRVGWTPDSRSIAYQVQNREQTWLDLDLFDCAFGVSKTLLRETSKGWVDVLDQPTWLRDGSFLWLSDRDGRTRVFHVAADGKVIRPVTPPDMRVEKLYGVDEPGGWIYYSSRGRQGVDTHVFRVSLNGRHLRRVSSEPGHHDAEFNSSFSMYLDTWSDIQTPPIAFLRSASGATIRPAVEKKESALKGFRLSAPEFLQVKTSDGHLLDAVMIKPLDFDASKKYPVMLHTYGGPEAPSALNQWAGRDFLWHELLATKGYLVWIVDPRSASGKGIEWALPIRLRLGELELRDLEESLVWLKKQPYVDGSRVGIWGWSYGGFMAAYALTHSKSFKIGIAGAPVTDWHLYDSIYTERYMGLPKNNPEGYENTSVLKAAGDLEGRLLLLHGMIDDNVHLQNSTEFMFALEKAGKQFDLMLYPESRHGVTIPSLVYHLRRLMTEFVLKNL